MVGKRGLSNATVVQLHRILHKAFAWAIMKNKIVSNSADTATLPAKRQHLVKIWDIPTIHEFLEVSEDTRFGNT